MCKKTTLTSCNSLSLLPPVVKTYLMLDNLFYLTLSRSQFVLFIATVETWWCNVEDDHIKLLFLSHENTVILSFRWLNTNEKMMIINMQVCNMEVGRGVFSWLQSAVRNWVTSVQFSDLHTKAVTLKNMAAGLGSTRWLRAKTRFLSVALASETVRHGSTYWSSESQN